ncbi:MAG: bacteriophage abortive infection AbiH family protein [Prevotella sp.]|nr:bacteriophage abortive infection AbiH family protein [Prevotella sp.]MBQ9094139.1 bacteriophage abortive infection AbiH family protein [Prevotella sp.]
MTLHVLGNGFDLYHGLPTRYGDFHDFLVSHGETGLIDSLERYWGHSELLYGNFRHTLWSDLEEALGEYDVEDIMSDMFDGHPFDIDHAGTSIGEVDAEVSENFVPLRERLTGMFSSWVRSMDLSNISRKNLDKFDPSGLFLVFNYTDTLEKVYGVPSSQVLHIHGDAGDTGDELTVGHNNFYTEVPQKDDFYDRTEYQHQIASVINGLYKDTAAIIARHGNFFKSLSAVDTVVVYGHSLAALDMPYFQEIHQNVRPNASWYISYHGDCVSDNAKSFASRLRINRVNYFEM